MEKVRDYYEILGVSKKDSHEAIKKAYRKLAKRYHPDKNQKDPNAHKRFAEISAAYQVLGDKQKRAQYDQGMPFGDYYQRRPGSGNAGFSGSFPFTSMFSYGSSDSGNFGNFFSDIFKQQSNTFGGSSRNFFETGSGAQEKSVDLDFRLTVDVSVEDIIKKSRIRVDLPNGKVLNVSLQPGIRDGQQIRLKQQGKKTAAKQGDALLTIKIRRDGLFRPEGNDLYLDLPISLETAVLGGKARADTPDGPVELKISANTTGTSPLRLRNKGLPKNDGSARGDLYVFPRIILPKEGDNELKQFITSRSKNV